MIRKVPPNCRKCGQPTDFTTNEIRHGRWTCAPCRRAYYRAWRKTSETELAREAKRDQQRAQVPGYRWKDNARVTLRRAIASGKVVRQPCEICGASPAQGHHDDYDKPLVVRWLCGPHHRQLHVKMKDDARIPERSEAVT